MKIFRTTRKMQIGSAIGFLFIILFFALFLYLPFWLMGTLVGSEASSSFLWGFFMERMPVSFLVVLGMILLMIWSGISIFATIKAQLIFEEDTLRLQTLDRLTFLLQRGVKPFSIPYNQISNIKTSVAMGRIEIFDQVGRNHTLLPALFGSKYGENIFLELKEHVPSEVFESGWGFSKFMEKWSKGNKFRIALTQAFVVVYFVPFLLDPTFFSRSGLTDAWHVEYRPFGFESVWTYSLASEDDFWIAGWHSNYYRVYKFSTREENEWKLPDDLLGRQYPQLISEDDAGLPIVWLDDRVLHYNAGDWKSVPYDRDLQLGDWDWRGVVSGEQAWAIDDEEPARHLLKIDALNGDWSTISLPETAKQQNLSLDSIKRTMHGDMLVLMQNEVNATVYVLSDDKWGKQEYHVILLPEGRIRDYFLDEEDALWVLFETQEETIVEKISPDGTLQLTQLPSIKNAEGLTAYRSIIVDSSERLWVGGYRDFMAVFTPQWGKDATEIVRYTEDNSNFQRDVFINPTLLPDGKIWAMDEWVSTMDTNLQTLPEPLPDWFASLDWLQIRLFSLIGVFITFLIGHLFFMRWVKR